MPARMKDGINGGEKTETSTAMTSDERNAGISAKSYLDTKPLCQFPDLAQTELNQPLKDLIVGRNAHRSFPNPGQPAKVRGFAAVFDFYTNTRLAVLLVNLRSPKNRRINFFALFADAFLDVVRVCDACYLY